MPRIFPSPLAFYRLLIRACLTAVKTKPRQLMQHRGPQNTQGSHNWARVGSPSRSPCSWISMQARAPNWHVPSGGTCLSTVSLTVLIGERLGPRPGVDMKGWAYRSSEKRGVWGSLLTATPWIGVLGLLLQKGRVFTGLCKSAFFH